MNRSINGQEAAFILSAIKHYYRYGVSGERKNEHANKYQRLQAVMEDIISDEASFHLDPEEMRRNRELAP